MEKRHPNLVSIGGTRVAPGIAGPRRDSDVQHYVELKAAEAGLKVLMMSVDLLDDGSWDLADLKTFETVMAAIAEGLVDVVFGVVPKVVVVEGN